MLTIKSSEFFKSVGDTRDLPRDGLPQVAFAGRSNVGKSSLINYLLRRKGLAKTSKSPGKTRLLNFFMVNDSFFFVDLPGYGYAKVSDETRRLWVKLLDRYFSDNESLRLVVWLLDVRRDPTEQDKELWTLLRSHGHPIVVALTKCDKLSKSQVNLSIRNIRQGLGLPEEIKIIPTSVLANTGSKEILSAIKDYL